MSQNGWRFCGNRQSVEKLRLAASRRQPRHAFLIAGIPLLGKRTLATRLAQALLCDHPSEGNPCFECGSCRKVLRGVHPDVSLFSLERQNATGGERSGKGATLTIETARSISAQAPLRPMNGDWRFVIVDDAELLMPDAQEALLKTIEEPPPFMVLFLIASDLEAMLPTIRSRCELLEFGTTPLPEIEDFLLERGSVPEVAEAAAAFSKGAPGWAIRASDDPMLIEEGASIVEQAAAWIESNDFERIATAFAMSDALIKQRAEAMSVIEATAGLWRDSLLARSGNSDRIIFRAHSELTDRLAGSYDIAELLGALSAVWTCLEDLRINVRPRLALESMVLSWPRMPIHSLWAV
jgi:DNA polymerase-3 subunit delta'